jgi:NADPH2:quinone reductase
MRAVLCSELGPPERLSIDVLDDPVPGANQLVVDVDMASFNFPDLLIIQGQYQFRAQPPFSPGGEGVGTVSAVGKGVTDFSVGDRVAAFGTFGAFAERWVVDEDVTVPLPETVSSAQAAASTMTYGTTYHALHDRADLSSGESLLVLGAAGGVGSAAIDIGKALGARVIAAASTQEKLDFCADLGADEGINYTTEDLKERAKQLTGGAGVDVIYDPVGGSLSEAAFRAIGWGGRHLVIGFAAGDIPKLPLNLPLLKGASVMGVFWGSFAMRAPESHRRNAASINAMISNGTLRPRVMEVVPFDDVFRGFELLASRSAMGKVLLQVS